MTKARLREKYRGISRQELINEAYELGANFEKYSGSCSQSTVAAIHELLEIDDVLVKAATSLCGGSAEQFLGTCGTLSGGIMVLDYFFGRPVEKLSYRDENEADEEALYAAFEPARRLADRFWHEYGTIHCAGIQRHLFGRFYCLTDPDEMEKFTAAGSHSDPSKTTRVVGNAAKWVMEILLGEGVVEV
jgi:hypothetical protein